MSYIDLIRKFWQLDATWQFGCCESRLYFYLVEQANRLGWPDNFTHSDRKLSENVGASRNAIVRAKNRLGQAGLLQVTMGGRGKGNRTSYSFGEKPESECDDDSFGSNINQSRSQSRSQNKGDTSYNISSNEDINIIDKDKTRLTSNEVMELWNSTCLDFPKVLKLSDQRKKKIKIRLSEFGGSRNEQLKTIEAIFKNMQASKFLQGDNDRKWSATFDWLFGNETNWVKVIEGNYNKSTTTHTDRSKHAIAAFDAGKRFEKF